MFEEILKRISAFLEESNIPYMIIGGQAVLLYGEPRLTRDIDITLGVNPDRLDELLVILKNFSLKPIPKDIQSFVKETMVLPVIDEPTGIRIDFIFSFTPYETEAIKRSKKVVIMGQGVSFASPEDLVIHKIFAGRPRDIEDVRSILLKNPEINRKYIRTWLKEFDSSSDKKGFLKTFEEILKKL
ncbi:MAG: nucleotidyl transferase AbiEii/AbiGii toxin family protein [Deltaproteobacteria bacterium]